jgi:hypothetical protein
MCAVAVRAYRRRTATEEEIMHPEFGEAMADMSARTVRLGGEARERRPTLSLVWGQDENRRRPHLRAAWLRAS